MIGPHWERVNCHSRGREITARITAATIWRTATTPTGPSESKAREPKAAPVWLLQAAVAISANPLAEFSGFPVDCGVRSLTSFIFPRKMLCT